MRTLSGTLEAAQQAGSGVPYVEVKASDRVANLVRLRWASEETDGAAPDDEHDATGDDLYLHRVRVRGGTPQYQRFTVATPRALVWTALNAQTDSNYICVAAINDTRVIVFYNRGASIYFRESTDQGATFGAETLALSGGSTKNALSAAYKTNGGDLLLVYADGTALKAARRTGGSFGSPSTWSGTANALNGVDVVFAGDFHLAVTGTDGSSNPRLWTVIYGDGFSQAADTWSAAWAMEEADSGSNVSYLSPSMAVMDTHRLVFVEKYTGTTAYSRLRQTWLSPSQSFAANAWREPLPFDLSSDNGAALLKAGVYPTTEAAWMSRPDEVWKASLSAPETDLTADVLGVALELRRGRGRARVTLRNDDGRFNDLPSGAYAAITQRGQVAVSPGYVTGSGNEKSGGMRFWIEGWEYTTEGGKATLVLHAADAWALVAGWRARRQHRWAAASSSVSQILRFVFGRAGVELLNTGSSSTALSHRPEFTIHPGENGLQAAGRLLAMLPDMVVVKGEFAYLFEPKPRDSSDYSYGGDHAIFRARYRAEGLGVNRGQVFGAGVFAEAFDWPEVEDGYDGLRQVFDVNLTTAALADQRATDTLRQEELEAAEGELVSPVNCGQEVVDVIDVTDAGVGLAAEKFRVVGIDLKYAREGRAVYEQRLLLGRA